MLMQGYFLAFQLSPSAHMGPLFFVGLMLQLFGLYNVIKADHILTHLRKPGETGENHHWT